MIYYLYLNFKRFWNCHTTDTPTNRDASHLKMNSLPGTLRYLLPDASSFTCESSSTSSFLISTFITPYILLYLGARLLTAGTWHRVNHFISQSFHSYHAKQSCLIIKSIKQLSLLCSKVTHKILAYLLTFTNTMHTCYLWSWCCYWWRWCFYWYCCTWYCSSWN